MKAIKLKTEHMVNPIGIDVSKPYLSWICDGGMIQTAYEISAYSNGIEIWNSGIVRSEEMHADFGIKPESRQIIDWKIRLHDEEGCIGDWSETAVFEMGLLDKDDFKAKWINPEDYEKTEINFAKNKPASYLKKEFIINKTGLPNQIVRLYITCHGVYKAFLNGKRVGDFVLAPGTGTYNKKLAYQTYDVTELIKEDKNELLVVLGNGWYRSLTGIDGDRNLFGTDISLYCQLEVNKEVVCVSDESWQAVSDGPIRENDMQQGENYDAGKEDILNSSTWHSVKTEDFGTANLACSNSVPIQEHESFKGRIIITPNGETVIDFGQNLAGYVEFTVNAHAGDKLVLWHGETLDENGNFTNENFQPGERHKEGGIQQKLTYICKEGRNHYKPSFTIMGFQYVKIETSISLEGSEFISHAVYSKMDVTARFTSSNEDLDKLVQNSIWSQKSNFCDIPTDCPTRERAGWTGDAGVFVDTGLYLMDSYPVFRKWLGECRLVQYEDGRVRNIAPPNAKDGMMTGILAGSTGWGDASIIVPYTLYKRYKDVRILEENYEMMQKWHKYLEGRANKDNVENSHPYVIDSGFDYGEWCEPGAEVTDSSRFTGQSVATAYLSYSSRLLSEIAEILGKEQDAVHYKQVSEMAKKAYRHVYTNEGKINSERQCEYVRAITFELLEEEESKQAAKELNELVINNNYHLNTGFLATPFLCEALAKHGYIKTAYQLLLQENSPGWLYAVKKGANTIWETWDGIKKDNTVSASLNHYSYGVISGWLLKGVCGITLSGKQLTITPKPYPVLEHARAEYDSPAGRIISGWSYEKDKLKYEFYIPSNVKADVMLPDGRNIILSTGYHVIV